MAKSDQPLNFTSQVWFINVLGTYSRPIPRSLVQKRSILNHRKALSWMDEHATFPKKIQYKVNSGDYSHESLELFYRINAVIYKAYEKKKITDLTQYKETVILRSNPRVTSCYLMWPQMTSIKDIFIRLLKSNFYTRKGWNESNPANEKFETNDQILSLGKSLPVELPVYFWWTKFNFSGQISTLLLGKISSTYKIVFLIGSTFYKSLWLWNSATSTVGK